MHCAQSAECGMLFCDNELGQGPSWPFPHSYLVAKDHFSLPESAAFLAKFNPLALFSFHEILRPLRKFANFAQICAPPLAGMRPL